jgi:hypothetical protein
VKKNVMVVLLCAAFALSACHKGENTAIEQQHPSDSVNTGDATTTNPAVVATDTSTTQYTATDTTSTSDISGTGATNNTGEVVTPTTHSTAGSEATGTTGTTATR